MQKPLGSPCALVVFLYKDNDHESTVRTCSGISARHPSRDSESAFALDRKNHCAALPPCACAKERCALEIHRGSDGTRSRCPRIECRLVPRQEARGSSLQCTCHSLHIRRSHGDSSRHLVSIAARAARRRPPASSSCGRKKQCACAMVGIDRLSG